MSAYPEFKLLPPPPTTSRSTSSPRRAQLPRFTAVDEVVNFAKSQVLARPDPVVKVSLFFVVVYIGLLELLALSVIIRRLLKRNFWLFRIVRRPDGLLLVPHLHNCWSFMAGVFGFIWTIYNIVSLIFVWHQDPPMHVGITLIYVWSPLYVGMSWMAWAAAVAGTQDLHVRIKITKRWRVGFTIAPWVANLIGIGIPFTCAVVVFFPSRLADRHSENARRLFIKWNERYAQQDTISEEMLVELQLIWFETIRHAVYLSIAALLWAIFASISLVVYCFFSIRLIRTLRRHLKMSRGKTGPISNAMTMSMGFFSAQDLADGDHNDPDEITDSGHTVRNRGTLCADASSQVEVAIKRPRPSRENPHLTGEARPATPLPKPSRTLPRPAQRDEASSVGRAVLYFVIQAGSINIGTLIVVCTMIAMAAITVAQTELGHFQETVTVMWMITSYTCVVFGTTTLCSIAHETYEESLASLIHPSRRSHSDSAPFKLSPVTISVVERRRRMPQQELQTELDHQIADDVPSAAEMSRTGALTYSDKQHPSISGDLSEGEGSILKAESVGGF
ncbi:hypothetical protein A4X13_0g395 [Tilletia indica]|uniref:Uncharacterized protein n=1 Tax=Tilletia indica TaxID=43049 RepID=A0A177TRG0_9BASI|nr:hypothetical protein A4X13_0g395 [Tilletia indica]